MSPDPFSPRCPKRTWWIPDRLPRLEHGVHRPTDGRMNVLEAAAWLAGEEQRELPRSVHPAVARVMRCTAAYPADATAELWPLILASVGSDVGRPRPLMWLRGVVALRRLRRHPERALAIWRGLVLERAADSGERTPRRMYARATRSCERLLSRCLRPFRRDKVSRTETCSLRSSSNVRAHGQSSNQGGTAFDVASLGGSGPV